MRQHADHGQEHRPGFALWEFRSLQWLEEVSRDAPAGEQDED